MLAGLPAGRCTFGVCEKCQCPRELVEHTEVKGNRQTERCRIRTGGKIAASLMCCAPLCTNGYSLSNVTDLNGTERVVSGVCDLWHQVENRPLQLTLSLLWISFLKRFSWKRLAMFAEVVTERLCGRLLACWGPVLCLLTLLLSFHIPTEVLRHLWFHLVLKNHILLGEKKWTIVTIIHTEQQLMVSLSMRGFTLATPMHTIQKR